MQPQLRQHLAGVKEEVLHDEVALLRLRRIGRLCAEVRGSMTTPSMT
jgi:hypothetical protein